MNLTLCREDGIYHAGGELALDWRVSRVDPAEIQSVEISVLWHTEGKGDEDLHVHHFARHNGATVSCEAVDNPPSAERRRQRIRCRLPLSPLSYHGRLITLRWCIRLRLFLQDGREVVSEQPFHLVSSTSQFVEESSSSDSPADSDPGDESQPRPTLRDRLLLAKTALSGRTKAS